MDHPVERAAKLLGSQNALAALLGVSKAAVSQWKDQRVPAEHCPLIEQATKGAVKCEELRPDVAWDVLLRRQADPVAQADLVEQKV